MPMTCPGVQVVRGFGFSEFDCYHSISLLYNHIYLSLTFIINIIIITIFVTTTIVISIITIHSMNIILCGWFLLHSPFSRERRFTEAGHAAVGPDDEVDRSHRQLAGGLQFWMGGLLGT